MAKALIVIDIGNTPGLLRLVGKVREDEQPRVLRHDSEDLAILLPTNPPHSN